jgi:hypothetical protein
MPNTPCKLRRRSKVCVQARRKSARVLPLSPFGQHDNTDPPAVSFRHAPPPVREGEGMMRRLFTLLSALSLLLCVGACVMWVRSYWVADEWVGQSGNWSFQAGSTRGALFRSSVGPRPSSPPQAPGVSGYTRTPAYSVRRGRSLPGDPGMRHQGGALGFWWFVSDGGTSVQAPPPNPSLPGGVSYGPANFAPIRQYFVPYWSVTLLLAVLPAAWIANGRRYWQQRLRSRGRCIHCGYDLRATPDRCPECGAETKSPAASAGREKRTA